MRQIELAIRQLLGARKYSVLYRIVSYRVFLYGDWFSFYLPFMALTSLKCAHVALRNYSLTHYGDWNIHGSL